MGKERDILDLVGHPLFDAILEAFIYTPHKWMPKELRAAARKPTAAGNPSVEALIWLDLTAPIVVEKCAQPDGSYKLPKEPLDRVAFSAAGIYLQLMKGEISLGTAEADRMGVDLMLATTNAQRKAAAARGAERDAQDLGDDSDRLNGYIRQAVSEMPDAKPAKIIYAVKRKVEAGPDAKEVQQYIASMKPGTYAKRISRAKKAAL